MNEGIAKALDNKTMDPLQLQDAGLLDDAGREGCGSSILDTGSAVINIAKNPAAFIDGVMALINSPAARAALGEAVVRQFQVNVMMLKDAWNSGDMRATGQALGKLTTDAAQLAGGVGAIAKLAVTTPRQAGACCSARRRTWRRRAR